MGLFNRRPRAQHPPSGPDGALPLSEDQAARVRRLLRDAFAERGIEVVVESDHVRDDSGRQFGLWNLSVACAASPEHEWPEVVGRHVELLLASPHGVDGLTDAELAGRVTRRLVERASLPDEWHPSAVTFVPGVIDLLCVDLPTRVDTPPESTWVERGGLDPWLQRGTNNLAGLLGEPGFEHHRLDRAGATFSVLLGESFFTASLALFLPDVLSTYADQRDLGGGVLVAIPNRHQLVWRVVDGPDCAASLNAMIGFAVDGFDEGAGPVSPHLYWARDGVWRQVTHHDQDPDGSRTIRVEVDPDLAEALARHWPRAE